MGTPMMGLVCQVGSGQMRAQDGGWTSLSYHGSSGQHPHLMDPIANRLVLYPDSEPDRQVLPWEVLTP